MPRMRNRYNENACTAWNFRKTEQTAVWAFCCFRECMKDKNNCIESKKYSCYFKKNMIKTQVRADGIKQAQTHEAGGRDAVRS